MKIEFTKEWCLRMAELEAQSTSDLDIGAGPLVKQAAPAQWPRDDAYWQPSNPRRDLVKAAALILAEIERIDRVGAQGDSK
jgi:hypothetical protein